MSDTNEQSEAGEFDAADFLRRLEQSGKEKELVAARRPPKEDLSAALSQFADFLYQVLDLQGSIRAHEEGSNGGKPYTWIPSEGSLGARDASKFAPLVDTYVEANHPKATHWMDTNPTRNPAAWATVFLRRCLLTVLDHMQGLAILVDSGQRLRAPITLSRTVLESSAVGCFIIDPDADPVERLRRTLNLHLEELKEASHSADGDLSAGYESQINELIEFAKHCGLPVNRYDPRRFEPPSIPGPASTRKDSASRIVSLLLPDVGRSMYRSLSAVAHARDSRTLLPDEYSIPHEIAEWRRTESVAWHAVAPLYAVQLLVQRTATYLGWDVAGWANAFEEVIKLWAVSGGLADAQIRSALGLPPVES